MQYQKTHAKPRPNSYPLTTVIGMGLRVIQDDDGKYLSSDAVYQTQLLSTGDQVKKLLENFGQKGGSCNQYIGKDLLAESAVVMKWAENFFLTDSSDYQSRCKELFENQQRQVESHDIGTIVSTIPMYQYSSDLDTNCKDSDYFGQQYQSTGILFLKLIKNNQDRGWLKCRSQDGNLFFFYLKNEKIVEHQLEVGDCFTLEAKVKDHAESPFDRDLSGKRLRVTSLNYAKVVKNYGKPK